MLNYKQLFYFWNVAKFGGVTRAAEQLNLTPQTISGQVSELEQHLNVELFRRQGRRLELTPTGKMAFSQADEIFQIGGELEGLLRSKLEHEDLVFRVGISDVVPKSIAYRLLSPTLQMAEDIRLVCHEDRLESLFAELSIHKLDLVITDRPMPAEIGVKGFSHLLGESSTAFYACEELAEQFREGFPASLDGAPMLIPGVDSAQRFNLERWFALNGISPRIKGEFDDTALMKAFGQGGVGIFPAPAVISKEAFNQHGVEVVGQAEDLKVRYYAVSAERKLRHFAVVAISESAQHSLFSGTKS